MPAKKIYDCFIFYNELELLKLRFSELYDHVDHFVLCEATVTFQGKPKPLYFDQNKADFEPFADKIIHVIVDDAEPAKETPQATNPQDYDPVIWNREHFQRNALRRGLISAADDDVIIISDCDEIICPDTVKYLRENSGYFLLDMPMYQFFLNMCAQESGWRKAFAYTYALEPDVPDYNVNRTSELNTFYEKFAGRHHYVKDGGWHFTFLGGADKVKAKLQAYSHTEGWQRNMQNDAILDNQMVELREVGGVKPLRFCRIDESFPKTLRENIPYYTGLGFIKDEFTRLKELEALWIKADTRVRQLNESYSLAVKTLGAMRRAGRGQEADLLTNIIPSSSDFAVSWDAGMQSERAVTDEAIPPLVAGNVVKRHRRDEKSTNPDGNIGYFNALPVEAGHRYTVSCFIWLPENTGVYFVELYLEGWPRQSKNRPDFEKINQWQRIWATGTAPPAASGCHLVLRASGHGAASVVYSTCWQFEEGDRPTPYRPTTATA